MQNDFSEPEITWEFIKTLFFWAKSAGLWDTLGCSLLVDSAQNQITISENIIRTQ